MHKVKAGKRQRQPKAEGSSEKQGRGKQGREARKEGENEKIEKAAEKVKEMK